MTYLTSWYSSDFQIWLKTLRIFKFQTTQQFQDFWSFACVLYNRIRIKKCKLQSSCIVLPASRQSEIHFSWQFPSLGEKSIYQIEFVTAKKYLTCGVRISQLLRVCCGSGCRFLSSALWLLSYIAKNACRPSDMFLDHWKKFELSEEETHRQMKGSRWRHRWSLFQRSSGLLLLLLCPLSGVNWALLTFERILSRVALCIPLTKVFFISTINLSAPFLPGLSQIFRKEPIPPPSHGGVSVKQYRSWNAIAFPPKSLPFSISIFIITFVNTSFPFFVNVLLIVNLAWALFVGHCFAFFNALKWAALLFLALFLFPSESLLVGVVLWNWDLRFHGVHEYLHR